MRTFQVSACPARFPHRESVAQAPACSRIHVVTVPPRGGDRSLLLRRFTEVIGVDIMDWDTGDDAANESLDAVQAELISRPNQVTSEFLDIRAQRRLVNRAVLPLMNPADPGRRRR